MGVGSSSISDKTLQDERRSGQITRSRLYALVGEEGGSPPDGVSEELAASRHAVVLLAWHLHHPATLKWSF